MYSQKVQIEIKLHLRQQTATEKPPGLQQFDGVTFEVPDFSYCTKIARRFHELAEVIQREEDEAERLMQKVKP
jgi:hypothetical protein